ncbi:MAG TPA: DEAD/DEAH box helicase [Actinomycetota bacterium]|nr:DEAD/DEAH box helicase [Actinomycetota bacterium]
MSDTEHAPNETPPAEDAPSFESLGVIEPIRRRLSERGIEAPFAIQALVMRDALDGRDILGKAKTGSGKTLAFSIPIVQRMREGVSGTQALVLVPTRELASQVADELRAISGSSAKIVSVYGGAGMKENLRDAKGAHILVATPGRLIDLLERRAADLGNVHMLVIDEADRMADMGFLPQVARILGYVPRDRQTMLFSATLDDQIMGLIAQTTDPVRHEVANQQVTVEGVEHHLFEVRQMDKTEVLISVLRRAPRDLTLVFTRTKAQCDRLAKSLSKAGLDALAIHGDLPQAAREKALRRFENKEVDVLVATDVAARGLDIEGITHVVNYDPPEDHKAYLHRIGRTARAGRAGVGITLATWQQRDDVERIAKRLHLRPHIVEMVSSDDRFEKIGSGELEHARPLSTTERRAEAKDVYRKLARRRRR